MYILQISPLIKRQKMTAQMLGLFMIHGSENSCVCWHTAGGITLCPQDV